MAAKVVIAGGIISITAALSYMQHLHRALRNQITHEELSVQSRKTASEQGELIHLPVDLLEYPQDFRVIHGRDSVNVADFSMLKNDQLGNLFTKLLRRNMSCFAQMPQSWMLWLLVKTPEQRLSFKASHIKSIDYQEGDLVCGFYRVVGRTLTKVEMSMEPPRNAGVIGGMLVIRLSDDKGRLSLVTETLQWTKAASGIVLPLERASFKFMHEMASWWLLVTGAEYFQSLEPNRLG